MGRADAAKPNGAGAVPKYTIHLLTEDSELETIKGFHAYDDQEAFTKGRKISRGHPFRLFQSEREIPIVPMAASKKQR